VQAQLVTTERADEQRLKHWQDGLTEEGVVWNQ
jgi:hypothetical protein